MGITLERIIFDIGGGIPGGKKFKAAQTGGPSGGCIPASLLNLPIDYDSLAAAGAIMGSGGLVIMDENTCMVDLAKFFLTFTQSESCGECVPCRIGTKRMLEILQRITEGNGELADLETLKELAPHGQRRLPLRPGADGAQPGPDHAQLLSTMNTGPTSRRRNVRPASARP